MPKIRQRADRVTAITRFVVFYSMNVFLRLPITYILGPQTVTKPTSRDLCDNFVMAGR